MLGLKLNHVSKRGPKWLKIYHRSIHSTKKKSEWFVIWQICHDINDGNDNNYKDNGAIVSNYNNDYCDIDDNGDGEINDACVN